MKNSVLPKAYEPAAVEEKWYQFWEEHNLFRADENSTDPAYSIVIPPPNVTGDLHMGHALNNTLQDILCRYRRMCGDNVLWMPGTDHAGIATVSLQKKGRIDISWGGRSSSKEFGSGVSSTAGRLSISSRG
jgi:valyl-tRNA synthetase